MSELRSAPGGDIMVSGGGTIVRELIAGGVIDELHLFVNPVALGGGMPMFPQLDGHQPLRLVHSQQFECGILGLRLEPHRS